MAVIKAANQLSVEAPIRNGQVIARNIANSGAELIATRQVEKA
jgi:CxxC motif-containing protein